MIADKNRDAGRWQPESEDRPTRNDLASMPPEIKPLPDAANQLEDGQRRQNRV